jgi:hypothetical protein
LHDFPSLLPNLLGLAVGVWASEISDSAWRTLPRAVLSRRIQLHIPNVELFPAADVLAAFREVVVDGAEIHISTQECNFLDSPSQEPT